jgi:hypothetical protein
MKHLFLFILFAFAANATAQDSTKVATLLQHSISGIAETRIFFSLPIGLRYDLRLRTPNPRIDWAVGATTSYYIANTKLPAEFNRYNTINNTHTEIEQNTQYNNYLTLHGLVLIGKKDFTFQTGLTLGIQDIILGNTEKTYNNSTNALIKEYTSKSSNSRISLFVPVGVRYQPAKSFITAWLSADIGLYTDLPNPKFVSEYRLRPISDLNLQLGIGYSLAPRATTIH